MVIIHYFFDPMCGWCYGATPLAEILYTAPNVKMILQPGGMIKKRSMDNSFRKMAETFDKEIALQTGQVFSQQYHERLVGNNTIILDSYITAQAIAVMEGVNGKGFDMLKGIQQAHYQDALDVSQINTLATIAKKLGVDDEHWSSLMKLKEMQVEMDIQHSHLLMEQWRVKGFPTFIMEKAGKQIALLHSNYYMEPLKWKSFIDQL